MKVRGIIFEDFINYKKPSMVIEFPFCSLKCDKECGQSVCQNSPLLQEPIIDIDCNDLILRYIHNPITEAIVMQGMEPMDSFEELHNFLIWFRHQYHRMDDVVIYTGYNKNEITEYINVLKLFPNIIIKYGRYIPNQESHYDSILGVYLTSDNQYAEKIS